MNIRVEHQIDSANNILICEVFGNANNLSDLSYLAKTVVKLAGKTQKSLLVVDVTQVIYGCSSVELSSLLNELKGAGLFGDLKVARVVDPSHYKQSLVGEIAGTMDLQMKNFASRSEALVWLLFGAQESK